MATYGGERIERQVWLNYHAMFFFLQILDIREDAIETIVCYNVFYVSKMLIGIQDYEWM